MYTFQNHYFVSTFQPLPKFTHSVNFALRTVWNQKKKSCSILQTKKLASHSLYIMQLKKLQIFYMKSFNKVGSALKAAMQVSNSPRYWQQEQGYHHCDHCLRACFCPSQLCRAEVTAMTERVQLLGEFCVNKARKDLLELGV